MKFPSALAGKYGLETELVKVLKGNIILILLIYCYSFIYSQRPKTERLKSKLCRILECLLVQISDDILLPKSKRKFQISDVD